jgi:hypothetical protein
MAASTNHALAIRAVKNARAMDSWAKQLLAEAKRQDIDFSADLSGNETIVLPLVIVRNMFESMRAMARDVGQFEPPKAAR